MSEKTDLFGGAPKGKRDKAPAEPSPVHEVIALYVELFKKRFGEKPVITPVDGKKVKELIAEFGQEKVLQRLPLYMALNDVYLHDAAYPLRLLPGQWNRLTVMLLQRGGSNDEVNRTTEYLRRLRNG